VNEIIYNPEGFARWAASKFGKNWLTNHELIRLYGAEQIGRLFDPDYEEPVEVLPDFSTDDFDYDVIKARATEEATAIMENPKNSHRTEEQIWASCIQGHYAEHYLIVKKGFIDCEDKFHDLIDHDGLITEVKTGTKKYLDEQFARLKKSSWNRSKRMIAYYVDGKNYYLYFDRKLIET
jgi:hypothetical protein